MAAIVLVEWFPHQLPIQLPADDDDREDHASTSSWSDLDYRDVSHGAAVLIVADRGVGEIDPAEGGEDTDERRADRYGSDTPKDSVPRRSVPGPPGVPQPR